MPTIKQYPVKTFQWNQLKAPSPSQSKEHKNSRQTAPKSLAWSVKSPYSDSGRHLARIFSACANDTGRLYVRLRRLGTVGIYPFQFNLRPK